MIQRKSNFPIYPKGLLETDMHKIDLPDFFGCLGERDGLEGTQDYMLY